MRNKDFIGVFDSGIGGLTVLDDMAEMLPNENFYYVADQKHCPYGPKEQSYVGDRVAKICKHLEEKGAKAVVIACNTASLQIARGQEVCNIPIISVIDPTCASAIKATKNNKVAVLATIATIKSGKYQGLLEKANVKPIGLPCGEFVDFVEHHDLKDPLGLEIVSKKLEEIKFEDFDTLIYGCTHFSLLEPQIKSVLGEKNYIRCGLPTAEYVKDLLEKKNLLNKDNKEREIEIYTTGSVEETLVNMKWFTRDHKPVKNIEIE